MVLFNQIKFLFLNILQIKLYVILNSKIKWLYQGKIKLKILNYNNKY